MLTRSQIDAIIHAWWEDACVCQPTQAQWQVLLCDLSARLHSALATAAADTEVTDAELFAALRDAAKRPSVQDGVVLLRWRFAIRRRG